MKGSAVPLVAQGRGVEGAERARKPYTGPKAVYRPESSSPVVGHGPLRTPQRWKGDLHSTGIWWKRWKMECAADATDQELCGMTTLKLGWSK
jgi:hypothetical protein